jgi:hypothetical protein
MIGSVLLGGGMFLAGCSASSNSAASSSEAAGHADGQAAGPAAAATAPPRRRRPAGLRQHGRSGGTGTTARLAPASSIIYTAQLTVRAGDVSSAAAQAAQIADGAGGYVSSETAKVNPDHPSEATASVQLKIPVAAYPATLGQLGHRLGTQLALQQQAQDVTHRWPTDSQVADQAIARPARCLHTRDRSANCRASEPVNPGSEPESMRRSSALSRQTSYATVTLTILGRRPGGRTGEAPAGGFPRAGTRCA